jgi:ribosomal protein S27E
MPTLTAAIAAKRTLSMGSAKTTNQGETAVSGRFPDVDWFCDRCYEHLNMQLGFDDSKYTWKCTGCGHKNSISRDNIYESHEDFLG